MCNIVIMAEGHAWEKMELVSDKHLRSWQSLLMMNNYSLHIFYVIHISIRIANLEGELMS